jgi:hypothetical protein
MGLNLRDDLIKASRLHFEAHIEKHRINVENLLSNSRGVADHPDIMDTIEKELGEISIYHDLLEVLNTYIVVGGIVKAKRELLNEQICQCGKKVK